MPETTSTTTTKVPAPAADAEPTAAGSQGAPAPLTAADATPLTAIEGALDDAGAAGPFGYGFADGGLVEVPKTPEEIAAEGSKLGVAGAFSTGGSPAATEEAAPGGSPADPNAPKFQRVWAMDGDHTVDNRHKPDQLHPDCSVLVAGKLT